MQPDKTDQELLDQLRANREDAIDGIFRRYYAKVCQAVIRVVKNPETAEDIAQEVFYELWKKREQLQITSSLGAYLRRAALNRSLNYLRDQRMQFEEVNEPLLEEEHSVSASEQLEMTELEDLIREKIEALPERCRIIFQLSRFEELSYKEIARQLDISEKTVEHQISKALKFLRAQLAPFIGKGLISLPLLYFWCWPYL
ncbi:MAG: RNA polymerase sigma-70 factor [Phaeodactylibacter sp.]|nr:RNA polymerase sigma-70 factor [Phaeodactylibacter sp.]